MRLLIVNLLATALVLFSAGFASAYTMTLVPTSPLSGVEGDIFTFDVYLDTEGLSGITLISVGLIFDESVVTYRSDLSDAIDYYPLYAPGVPNAKATDPATWLVPTNDPPAIFVAQSNLLNIDFTEKNLGQTTATATNLLLATVAFQAIPGSAGSVGVMNFSFDSLSNTFNANGGEIKNDGNVFALGSTEVTVVPEPTTALLIGLGLVGLGVAGRNRA